MAFVILRWRRASASWVLGGVEPTFTQPNILHPLSQRKKVLSIPTHYFSWVKILVFRGVYKCILFIYIIYIYITCNVLLSNLDFCVFSNSTSLPGRSFRFFSPPLWATRKASDRPRGRECQDSALDWEARFFTTQCV